MDLALLGLSALAVLPRLTHLGSSLWNDELFATHVWLSFSRQSLAWMAYDTHPPLYHVLMLLWISVFGDSALSIRVLPLLCSAASVFWMGRVAAHVVGPGGGLLAAALLALSGASVFYGQEARSYSLVILLLLLMSESFLRMSNGDRRAPNRLLVCSMLCAAIHVYAFLFVLCFWVLVPLTARSAREAAGLARAALVPPAVAAPFYFLIALLIVFTDKHVSVLSHVTHPFTVPDVARLVSFYLFGYRGVDAPSAVHVLSAVLFLGGVAVALKRRPAAERPASPTDFPPRWIRRLFGWSIALGLSGALAAVAAPWWLPPPQTLQAFVGAEKHPDLIGELPRLLRRTGVLYALGYLALVGLWIALDRATRPGARARLEPRLRLPLLNPVQVLVVLPLLAILLVMVVCHVRPTYNHRYMLGLLPFAILIITVGLSRLPASWPRALVAGLVIAGQAVALTDQDDAYAWWKPDYKGALAYVSRGGQPVTGTALWELENLNRYYAGRGEIEPLTVLPPPEAGRVGHVVVFEPRAYPLDAPHRTELRELVRRRTTRTLSFLGLTLYELGPAEVGEDGRGGPAGPAAGDAGAAAAPR